MFARLERVKALWREISQTPQTSARYKALADAIRVEALAYRAGVNQVYARADSVNAPSREISTTSNRSGRYDVAN